MTLAASGLDQNPLSGGFDQVAVKTGGDAIELVGGHERIPERLGDDAEESSAIPPIHTSAQKVDANITDFYQ